MSINIKLLNKKSEIFYEYYMEHNKQNLNLNFDDQDKLFLNRVVIKTQYNLDKFADFLFLFLQPAL